MSTQHRCPHWNYRLMNGSTVEGLSIREVSYDEDGGVVDWSPFPASIEGESAEELKFDLREMLEALDKPTLDEAELEQKLGECPNCRQEGIKHDGTDEPVGELA